MKSIHDARYIEMIHLLKKIRKNRKINQSVIAKHLGLDRTHVSKTENLVRRLDFIELCDWLEALDYGLEDFLRDLGRIK